MTSSATPQQKPFSQTEFGTAAILAAIVQLAFFALLAWAGASSTKITKVEDPKPEVIPIAVQPVIDDVPLPLLKLGSKQKVKSKLPDIWKKQAPVPVKRYEERSAPSEDAEDDPDEIVDTPLADKDHEAPPEDAELTKEAIPNLEDSENTEETVMDTEGAADGSKDGTETDPLKARALDQYKVKIAGWFNARFRPPVDSVPCDELKKLMSRVTVQVGIDRSIVSFSVGSASGNAIFDAKVQSTMSGLIGQELPPPPPLYPDIQQTSVFPILSGAGVNCAVAPAPSATTP